MAEIISDSFLFVWAQHIAGAKQTGAGSIKGENDYLKSKDSLLCSSSLLTTIWSLSKHWE